MERVGFSDSYIKAQKQREEENKIAKQRILADIKYNIYNNGISRIYCWEEKYIDDIIRELEVRIVKVKEMLILDRKHLVKLYKLNKLFEEINWYCVLSNLAVLILGVIICVVQIKGLDLLFAIYCIIDLITSFVVILLTLCLETMYYKKFNNALKQQVMLLGKFDKHYADRLLEKGYTVYWDEIRNKYVVGDITGK